MKIVSFLEDKKVEKRISITPEIAKKYIAMGFEVSLSESYGEHLGFSDNEYKKLNVKMSKDDNELIDSADVIVQLGLPSEDKLIKLSSGQSIIGVLNPYNNKLILDNLIKKKINLFSLELLPRITRAQSMDILSSQANLAGYKAVVVKNNFVEFNKQLIM